jgi:hypothetical protein
MTSAMHARSAHRFGCPCRELFASIDDGVVFHRVQIGCRRATWLTPLSRGGQLRRDRRRARPSSASNVTTQAPLECAGRRQPQPSSPTVLVSEPASVSPPSLRLPPVPLDASALLPAVPLAPPVPPVPFVPPVPLPAAPSFSLGQGGSGLASVVAASVMVAPSTPASTGHDPSTPVMPWPPLAHEADGSRSASRTRRAYRASRRSLCRCEPRAACRCRPSSRIDTWQPIPSSQRLYQMICT